MKRRNLCGIIVPIVIVIFLINVNHITIKPNNHVNKAPSMILNEEFSHAYTMDFNDDVFVRNFEVLPNQEFYTEQYSSGYFPEIGNRVSFMHNGDRLILGADQELNLQPNGNVEIHIYCKNIYPSDYTYIDLNTWNGRGVKSDWGPIFPQNNENWQYESKFWGYWGSDDDDLDKIEIKFKRFGVYDGSFYIKESTNTWSGACVHVEWLGGSIDFDLEDGKLEDMDSGFHGHPCHMPILSHAMLTDSGDKINGKVFISSSETLNVWMLRAEVWKSEFHNSFDYKLKINGEWDLITRHRPYIQPNPDNIQWETWTLGYVWLNKGSVNKISIQLISGNDIGIRNLYLDP